MDVTWIGIKNGSKRSLQVIQDNKSRAILAWHLSTTVSAEDSQNLIRKANSDYSRSYRYKPTLVTDGGPENKVREIPFIRTKLARKEIRYANTMIEVFFKTLKSQFLSYQSFENEIELVEALSFFIEQYNEVIPRRSLGGYTPREILENNENLVPLNLHSQGGPSRKAKNRLLSCKKCI